MERNKVLSMLGLATKAGKLKSGEFAVEASIKNHRARLVFISEEASPSTMKTFKDKCSYHKIPFMVCFSKEELGKASGKGIRTLVSVEDKGFSDALLNLLNCSANGGC